ncbi:MULTISPECIES: hypothetical protein [Myxococcus]|nr:MULTISPECIES: hypothetical protein [Myxococcus]
MPTQLSRARGEPGDGSGRVFRGAPHFVDGGQDRLSCQCGVLLPTTHGS